MKRKTHGKKCLNENSGILRYSHFFPFKSREPAVGRLIEQNTVFPYYYIFYFYE